MNNQHYSTALRGTYAQPMFYVAEMPVPQTGAFSSAGRLSEFELLTDRWGKACNRRPSLVLVRGDPGIGKTKLMQDFYRFLAATQDPNGYWPLRLTDAGKAITIVPQLPARSIRDTPPIPWLWLAVRCRAPAHSNALQEDIEFDLIRRQLQWHLAGIFRKQQLRKLNAAIAKATVATVAGFAFPGAGNVVNAIQAAVGEGLSLTDQIGAIIKRYSAGKEREADTLQDILERDRATLVSGARQALEAIAGASSQASAAIPVLLLIDDAQWADNVTLEVLDALQISSWEQGWRLMTVLTCRDDALQTQEGSTPRGPLARLLENTPLARETIHMKALPQQTVKRIIRTRLPRMADSAATILASRSEGNIDLLHDFLDEIKERAWLDARETLRVPEARLRELPSTELRMARQRVRTINAEVVRALAYASVQGIEFHEAIVAAVTADTVDALSGLLCSADSQYQITRALPHATLGLDCEFRRPVYWEVSRDEIELITRGDYVHLKQRLATAIRDILKNAEVVLTRRERGILAGRLLELRDELPLKGKRWDALATGLELDLASIKLDVGDPASAEALAERAMPQARGPDRIRGHRLFTEAAHMTGNRTQEKRRLEEWARDQEAGGVELLLRQSSLSLQRGATTQAVRQAREAVVAAGGDTFTVCTAETYLAHALWARGAPDAAVRTLAQIERRGLDDPQNMLMPGVQHSAALALHDLERNLQVIDQAKRCVQTYKAQGRLEAQLVAAINLGDAYWGAGQSQRARLTLSDAHQLALDANLPQAIDIASICLANVLASTSDTSGALALYQSGVALATKIGHKWDQLYGEAYRCLACSEQGDPGTVDELFTIAERARRASYPYVRSLACAYAAVAAYSLSQSTAPEVLEQAERSAPTPMPPGPAAHLAAIRLLLAADDHRAAELKPRFLGLLGACEGLKGRPELALKAITRLRKSGLLTNVEGEFVTRWEARFAWHLSHRPDSESSTDGGVRLRRCDYRTCEARCCYDGVYLEDDDIVRINEALALDREYFCDVPEDWLTSGTWNGESGPKTAVRPHEYASPDFPAHFNHTRCVFAAADGACTLQSFAIERNQDPWAFKPLGCSLHPLRVHPKPTVTDPAERDPGYLHLEYPGYATFAPCGQSRADGAPWKKILRDELAAWRRRPEGTAQSKDGGHS